MDRRTERELLISCVLGDGCIAEHGKWQSHWLKLTHCLAQKDYLLWKVALIESTRLVRGRHFTVREKINKCRTGSYPIVTANMYGLRYFRILRKWLYPAGRKSSQHGLKYMLSPLSLAVLFMDDGCVEKRKRKHKDGTVYFLPPRMSLGLFEGEEESLAFLAWMAVRFGVQGYTVRRPYKDPVKAATLPPYFVLMFNCENACKVWELIAPFVIQTESMRKKFAFCVERLGWPASAVEVARVPSTQSIEQSSIG